MGKKVQGRIAYQISADDRYEPHMLTAHLDIRLGCGHCCAVMMVGGHLAQQRRQENPSAQSVENAAIGRIGPVGTKNKRRKSPLL